MRSLACALVLAGAVSAPALAAEFSGILGGGYDNFSGSGFNVDGYDVAGSALASFGGWSAQGDIGYQKASLGGVSVKDTGFQGDLFWRDPRFALGGSVRYDDLSASIAAGPFSVSAGDHLTSYGAFGEYYVTPQFTLQAAGGGTDGAFSGSYFGIGAKYYLSPHFSLQPLYSYQDAGSFGHTDTYGGQVEAFFSPRVPIGVTFGYTHSTSSGTGLDFFRFGLNWRFGPGGDLRAWDRMGPTRWTGGLNIVPL
jgi:hypothetical protein